MRAVRFLANDVLRCAGADKHDCEERHNCARWMLREPAGEFAVWADFAARRDPDAQECRFFWPVVVESCELLLV